MVRSKTLRLTTVLFMGAALVLPALAQQGALPSQLTDHWKTSRKYLIALAEQMPAEAYAFKPNPDEMSFGQQMAHIAAANTYYFSTLTGQKNPLVKPTDFEKANVLKLLNTSYDFVIAALDNLDHERMMQPFDSPTGNGKMTGMELYMMAVDHTAHHRGQCIVYLRMKGIKPVDYQF
jgi:uncharacterized damage-inducible protein DinB